MSKKKWSDKRKLKLFKMYMKDGSQWAQFAKELNMNKEAIRAMFNRTDWDSFLENNGVSKEEIEEMSQKKEEKDKPSIEEEARLMIDSRKERVCELGEKRKMNEYLENLAKSELIFEKIKSSITQVPLVTPPRVKQLKRKKGNNPQEAFMLVSDVHVGLAVVPEEVGNLGEYNISIFKKRLENYTSKVINITESHRGSHDIDTLNVAFLGDLVHGGNDAGSWGFLHSEQNVMDQVFTACSSFLEMLAKLSQTYSNIKVHCVYGNHGRIAKRGVEKKFVNWDYLIYKWMEASMNQYDNIDFTIPRGAFQIAESLGNKFLLIHGDQARSWSGIPWYGLQRLESKYRSVLDGNKTIEKMWQEMNDKGIDPYSVEGTKFAYQYMKSFDYMILGHFHTMGEVETPSGGRIMMNASFIGADDYAANDLVCASVPAQKFFGVNKHGKTWSYDLELDR